METCRDCLHFDVCETEGIYFEDEYIKNVAFSEDIKDLCHTFKNKSDYVEVKHGEWMRPTTVGGITIAGLPHCSVCGVVPCDEGKYCPNCGAKMDGGAE